MGKIFIKKTPTGEFNFHVFAKNGEKVAISSETYKTKSACLSGLKSVAKFSKLCLEKDKILDYTLKEVKEITNPRFEVYLDKAEQYRYRLRASNGENIAISEESYKTKDGCIGGLKSLTANVLDCEIIDETK